MKRNTKDMLLEKAEELFAKNGFYGTSIHEVAADIGVSKQGLLHHFPSKEKLYAAVLQNAADKLTSFVQACLETSEQPNEQLLAVLLKMSEEDDDITRVVILLMRELLDNRDRAEQVHKWFLRPFLDELVSIVKAGQIKGSFKDKSPLAFVYQLLGATQYFLISQPTLSRLYSAIEFEEHRQQHRKLIENLVNQ